MQAHDLALSVFVLSTKRVKAFLQASELFMFAGPEGEFAFQFRDFWQRSIFSQRQVLSYGLGFAGDVLVCRFML